MTGGSARTGIGNRIAPPRFIAFAILMILGCAGGIPLIGWRHGVMAAFDIAALVFLLSSIPLLRDSNAEAMRHAAIRNDANRAMLLGVTGTVMLVILIAVAAELAQKAAPSPPIAALVIATLAIAWVFSNLVYALHYAHLFYTGDGKGGDSGGLDVPDAKEPDYWDFVYFAFTLGMTFQTSDIDVTSGRIRKVVTFHCFAAFVFNIGVLAFTINVLGD